MPLVSALRLAGVNCAISRKFGDKGIAVYYRSITKHMPNYSRSAQPRSAEFKISLLTYEMGNNMLRVSNYGHLSKIANSKVVYCRVGMTIVLRITHQSILAIILLR